MRKPDWQSAPERALWLAQEQAGDWFWFELQPFPHPYMDVWATFGASWSDICTDVEPNDNWRETLESRP